MSAPGVSGVEVRRAEAGDAAGIVAVLEAVVGERIHSAIDTVWSVERQASHLRDLSGREAYYVAVDGAGGIIGVQSLELWSAMLPAMAHVGQVGTFVLPGRRGAGVGRGLWWATERFAREAGYRKLAILVRGSNAAAQGFYRSLGFRECGRLGGQVMIDGREDDEVLMELFLSP
jgi:L-amino acid N-acyltransferase YncA